MPREDERNEAPAALEPAPCYVYYGEERYFADDFLRRLRRSLMTPEAPEFSVARFNIEESSLADILDAARTSPFFFSPWQVVVAEIDEDSREEFTELEKKLLRDYLRSPNKRTVLFFIIDGRVKKTHPLVRFFSSLRLDSVVIEEMKPIKDDRLPGWIEQKARALGKAIIPEAAKRMAELVGNDLWRVENELLKVVAYAVDRKVIDVEDIDLVCDWKRSFLDYELTNALEERNREKVLVILNQFFEEGEEPEKIIGVIGGFFRDIMLARLWLRENIDRKEIFARLRPQLKESFGLLYSSRFNAFFSLVGGMSDGELNSWLAELGRIDLAVKTTEVSPQVMLEKMLIEYCRRWPGPKRKAPLFGRRRGE